jgi:hypothetical protein
VRNAVNSHGASLFFGPSWAQACWKMMPSVFRVGPLLALLTHMPFISGSTVQTHSEVCLVNFLGVSQSSQDGSQDEPSQVLSDVVTRSLLSFGHVQLSCSHGVPAAQVSWLLTCGFRDGQCY